MTSPFGAKLFSLAYRERCLNNLKNYRIPLLPKANHDKKSPLPSAAVLVPMCNIYDTPSLLYTIRSAGLRSHSGQISFPGGKCDKNETPVATALRETKEEIGLSPEKVDIWGNGPTLPGRNNEILVTPVIGSIEDLKKEHLRLNKSEVAEVFAVPIKELCDPRNQYYTQFKNGYVLPVYVADEYKIWGLTAIITHIFLSSLLSKEIYYNNWMKKKIVIKG